MNWGHKIHSRPLGKSLLQPQLPQLCALLRRCAFPRPNGTQIQGWVQGFVSPEALPVPRPSELGSCFSEECVYQLMTAASAAREGRDIALVHQSSFGRAADTRAVDRQQNW